MNHYRCSRPSRYGKGTYGYMNPGARQGHYQNAESAPQAGEAVAKDYTNETIDVQAWGVDEIPNGTLLGSWNDLTKEWFPTP